VQVLGQLRQPGACLPWCDRRVHQARQRDHPGVLAQVPTATEAGWLSPGRLGSWLRSVGYTGGVSAGVLHGRLPAAAPGLAGAEGEARGQNTLALVAMLSALTEQITVLDAEIGKAFAAHPDQHIFASLPPFRNHPRRNPAG
jgi:hypothetical protein